jgi:hypothetical protein
MSRAMRWFSLFGTRHHWASRPGISSYLPSSVFSRTLVDLLTPGSTEPEFADIERGVQVLKNSPKLQQSLGSILKAANGEVDSFLSATQVWFDRQMDRVTGSYKR